MTARSNPRWAAIPILVLATVVVAAGAAQAPSGIIRGRVVRAGSGDPVRRVVIDVLSASDGRRVRRTLSDVDGRYEVRELPRGSYSLRASRNGFAPMDYGQRYPFQLVRRTVTVDDVAEGVDFALIPAAAISGVVLDEIGEPLAGAFVAVARPRMVSGRRTFAIVWESDPTNDLGEFRVSSLPAGEYIVGVAPRLETPGTPTADIVVEYLPTYYPGTNSAAEAQRVRVRSGEEVSGLVLPVTSSRMATISGVVAGANQTEPLTVRLSQQSFNGSVSRQTKSGNGGEFRFTDVPPGDYTVEVSRTRTSPLNAIAEVRVVGRDVNVTLNLRAPPMLRGQVRLDAAASAALPPASSITVMSEATLGDRQMSSRAQLRNDWTFEVPAVFGTAATIRTQVPAGWAVRSVSVSGKNVVGPVPVDGDVSGVEITLTNRLSRITGSVLDAEGKVAADATVLMVPDTRAQPAATLPDVVRTALVDSAGRFAIRDALPGRYVAVALTYVEEGSDNDRDWLAKLLPAGTPVSVTTQELQLDLRLTR